jgi:predicted transcriptional regulator
MSNILTLIRKKDNNCALSGMITSLDAECKSCQPISPLQCINSCQVYRLKNELRRLGQAMSAPDYMKALFNALKNSTRLQTLKTIETAHLSLEQISQVLRTGMLKANNVTVTEEVIRPLVEVGLVSEGRGEYFASSFGFRVTEKLGCFADFVKSLPPHSEGYEEVLLQFLLAGPKTFEDIEGAILPTVVSRTLKRLRSAGLVKASKGKDYVFFFRTIRNPNKEILTVNERRVHAAIFNDGISAGKLSKEANISKRLIYRYLRRLRGKKLVFTRRAPKIYHLTCKGKKMALVLAGIQQLVEDTWLSSRQIIQSSSNVSPAARCLVDHGQGAIRQV